MATKRKTTRKVPAKVGGRALGEGAATSFSSLITTTGEKAGGMMGRTSTRQKKSDKRRKRAK